MMYGKSKTLKIGKDYKSSTIENLNLKTDKKLRSKLDFQDNGKGLIKTSQKLKNSSVNLREDDEQEEANRLVVNKANLRKQFMKEREMSFRTDKSLGYKFPYFRIIYKTFVITVLFALLVLVSNKYISDLNTVFPLY